MIIPSTVISAAALLSPADVADKLVSFNTDNRQDQAQIETVCSTEEYNLKLGATASFSAVPFGNGQHCVDDWN